MAVIPNGRRLSCYAIPIGANYGQQQKAENKQSDNAAAVVVCRSAVILSGASKGNVQGELLCRIRIHKLNALTKVRCY